MENTRKRDAVSDNFGDKISAKEPDHRAFANCGDECFSWSYGWLSSCFTVNSFYTCYTAVHASSAPASCASIHEATPIVLNSLTMQ